MAQAQATQGKIVQCIGAVVDVEFPRESVPKVYDALKVQNTDITLEVQQQLGDGVVRCIALGSTDGLKRNLIADNTGRAISVPVGKGTLGRIMCGWGDWDAFYANGQALFRVRAVGQRAYILENKRSGQCLQYEQGTRAVVFSSQNCNAGNLSAIWYIEGSYSYTFSTIRPCRRWR